MEINPTTLPLVNLEKLVSAAKFIAAVETEDELGCVLRIHLCLENYLEEFLKNFIPAEQKKFHKGRPSFSEKLSLAVAYGLCRSIAESIWIINKLRNRFAHIDDSGLTDEINITLAYHVDNIHVSGIDWLVKKSYIEFCQDRPGEKLKFGEHGPRIDFIIIAGRLLGKATFWLVTEYIKKNPNSVQYPAGTVPSDRDIR